METEDASLRAEGVCVEEEKQTPASAPEKGKKSLQNALLIVIAALLFLQVAVSAFGLYLNMARDQMASAQRASIVQSVNKYTENVNALTNQMLEQYKKEVYGGGKVDTVEKQLVMGAEYNFMGLMLLVRQNNEIIKMLTQLK